MVPRTKMHRCHKDDLPMGYGRRLRLGRTMKKAMATFDINPQNWYELAADREKWHAMIK